MTANNQELMFDAEILAHETPEKEINRPHAKKSQIATLDELAELLPADAKSNELKLRPTLINANHGFRVSKYDLGKVLTKYREFYKNLKKQKGNPSRFDQVLYAIRCERSCAYRLMAGCKQADDVGEEIRTLAIEQGIDLAETKHSKLVAQIKIAMSRRELSPADALEKAKIELKRLSKVSAPTIPKESGPMPTQAVRSRSFDYAQRKHDLIAEYRQRYVSTEEADKVIDALIVAALEAQLAKLPPMKEAA